MLIIFKNIERYKYLDSLTLHLTKKSWLVSGMKMLIMFKI